MTHLKIRNHCQGGVTLLDNAFIDHYMAEANGEYVKAYLVLLRYGARQSELTIAAIADCLECTERDVVRALAYWEKNGLLTLDKNEDGDICGISITRLPEQPARYEVEETEDDKEDNSEQTTASVSDMRSYKSRKDFAELTYVAECYLGKTLTKTESDMLSYFLDDLLFPVDLIEYLIEYSVESGHKSFRYMKAIAQAWAEKGIFTVEEARRDSDEHSAFSSQCTRILKAYGITGRFAGDTEQEYIHRWLDEFKMPMDIILEAVKRTLDSIHQPGFAHTNKILSDWYERGIRTIEDVKRLDPRRNSRSGKSGDKRTRKFNNAPARTYDMDELEQQLLQSN